MIDIRVEKPVTLAEAAKLACVCVNGKPRDLSTIYRWTTNGIKGQRLETVQIGGSRCTTEEAVIRFIESRSYGDARASPRTNRQRERAVRRAKEELANAGF